MVFENPVVKEILEKYRVIWALNHAGALMGWDSQTYMPEKGVVERAIARAEISVLVQQLMLRDEFVSLVERAKGIEGLNEYESGVVRVLDRAISIYKKIPPRLVHEIAKTSQEAQKVWVKAKEKSDYNMFKPYLSKIVRLAREVADHLGYEDHPYNALLDLYEEGLRISDVDSIFDKLIPESKRILDKVLSEERYPRRHELEDLEYKVDVMKEVNKRILDLLEFPWDRARLDVSPHPFTTHMGIDDVRITTRYEGRDFRRSMYAVIHEYGHALYELQIDPNLRATPIASGASLGIHESQSRFWENIVGRSMPFTIKIKSILDNILGFTKKYSTEDLYRYFNIVRPSLIRVDSDELTYNFHIYLRYTIEKDLIAGEINVDDLPEIWNETMEKLLGVRPKRDSEGVLQDIHWSGGSIGYFPTYTLGNVIAAQIKARIEQDLNKLDELILEDRFSDLRNYLREKIHKWGSTFAPKDLLVRSIGEQMNPEYLIAYFEQKYLKHRV
ncbi:MAG: carboxypeptidase M32 [Desulfurococcales archaeon]|nr:carboxypeptidase M32 [Desulfurococcales archaeon]